MSKDGSSKTKPCNLCICQSCKDLPEFDDMVVFKEHLSTVHGVDPKISPFSRKMLMHMDSDEWYETQYQWTEQKKNGVRFQQLVRGLRDEKNIWR